MKKVVVGILSTVGVLAIVGVVVVVIVARQSSTMYTGSDSYGGARMSSGLSSNGMMGNVAYPSPMSVSKSSDKTAGFSAGYAESVPSMAPTAPSVSSNLPAVQDRKIVKTDHTQNLW